MWSGLARFTDRCSSVGLASGSVKVASCANHGSLANLPLGLSIKTYIVAGTAYLLCQAHDLCSCNFIFPMRHWPSFRQVVHPTVSR